MKNKKIIEAKFKRFNLNISKTKLWEDLTDDNKEMLLDNCRLNPNERPIIVFQLKSYNWILTSEHLIINENGSFTYYLLTKIDGIKVADFSNTQTSKQEFSTIEMVYQGDNIGISIEPGTWHAISNILKFMVGGKGIVDDK
jgi:hypothetical protein